LASTWLDVIVPRSRCLVGPWLNELDSSINSQLLAMPGTYESLGHALGPEDSEPWRIRSFRESCQGCSLPAAQEGGLLGWTDGLTTVPIVVTKQRSGSR